MAQTEFSKSREEIYELIRKMPKEDYDLVYKSIAQRESAEKDIEWREKLLAKYGPLELGHLEMAIRNEIAALGTPPEIKPGTMAPADYIFNKLKEISARSHPGTAIRDVTWGNMQQGSHDFLDGHHHSAWLSNMQKEFKPYMNEVCANGKNVADNIKSAEQNYIHHLSELAKEMREKMNRGEIPLDAHIFEAWSAPQHATKIRDEAWGRQPRNTSFTGKHNIAGKVEGRTVRDNNLGKMSGKPPIIE